MLNETSKTKVNGLELDDAQLEAVVGGTSFKRTRAYYRQALELWKRDAAKGFPYGRYPKPVFVP